MSDHPKNLTIGVHDIPAEWYHGDPVIEPSLSNSLAKDFIDGCPLKAWLGHPRLNPKHEPRDPRKRMNFGSLAHKLILGKGSEIEVCTKSDWKTDFAKEFKKDALARGAIPCLQADFDEATRLREGALREFNRLGLDEVFLKAAKEQTYVFRESDCYLRSMIDAVNVIRDEALGYIFDLKITGDASNDACTRRIGEGHYDMQAHFQSQGVLSENKRTGLAIEGRLKHYFLFIEDAYPFLVNAVELSEGFREMGRIKYNFCLRKWKKCVAENRWPGYSPGITTAEPKPWDLMRAEQLAITD
jgi:hypothetical protein